MFTKKFIEELLQHLEICGCEVDRKKKLITVENDDFYCFIKLLKTEGYEYKKF